MAERPQGVECRLNLDKSFNPKYIDLLDEDKPVAGQQFCCISFISPEKILANKDLYFFKQFLKQWDMSKSLQKFTQFINFLSYKYNLDFDKLTKDLDEFCIEEKDNLFSTTLEDEYKTFIDNNEERIEKEFNNLNNFQTSTRGIKIRGSYPSQQEAELRCKMLREVDPNHDVYVGPVGTWMPFHPEAYKTGRVDYLEDELNQLMNEKQKNEKAAKVEFDKRIKEMKEKAIEDNKRKALESGNVLTQTIDKDSNLISVKDVTTFESGLTGNMNVEVADIRRELFDSENIVIDYKNSDHGLSQLTKNNNVNIATEVNSTTEVNSATEVNSTTEANNLVINISEDITPDNN